MNIQKIGRLAGYSLILMAIVAGVAYGYIFQNMYIDNNPAATDANFNMLT